MRTRTNHLRRALLTLLLAGGAASAANAEDIRIGVAATLTGPAAQYGVAITNGFQLAADEINAAGGLHGKKIHLVVEDEQGKKEEAISVFKRLIFREKVLMVFGPTLSNSAQAGDPVAQAAKTVVFGTSNTADGITAIGEYVFRNSAGEVNIVPHTLAAAMRSHNIKKVAIIYGNDDAFTRSGYDSFKKALDAEKIEITASETFAKGDVDFKPQLTKIKSTEPDAIVLSAIVSEGGPIMVQARQLGLQQPFLGTNGMNSPRIFELAKGVSDGLYVGSPWSATNPAPVNVKFIESYTARFKNRPDQFAALAYDGLYIAAEAIKRVKLTANLAENRVALQKALTTASHAGVTGDFRFQRFQDKGYDAQQKMLVSVTKGDQFVLAK